MRREEAEAQLLKIQQDDREHTYLLRESEAGVWRIVRIDIPSPPSSVLAERGEPAESREDVRSFISRLIPPYGPPGLG